MHIRFINLFGVASLAVAQTEFTSTAAADVAAAAATARTESPVSNIKGKAFDRILTIYLETTAFNNTIADRNTIVDAYNGGESANSHFKRTVKPLSSKASY